MPKEISNTDIEKYLLAAYADNADLFVKCQHLVSSAIFTTTATKFTYKTIKAFHAKNIKPDTTLLFNEAKKAGLPRETCIECMVSELKWEYTTQPEMYVEILFKSYVAKYLMPILQDAHSKLLHDEDALEVMGVIKNAITEVELAVNNVSKEKSIDTIVDEAIKQIKDAKASDTGFGYPTGVSNVDDIIGGLTPGIIMIGARPSMGKTSFIVNIIRKNAIDNDVPVVMFSLEMPATQIVKNLMANMYEINSFAIKTGQISDDEQKMIEATKIRLKKNLTIDDTPAITWQYVDAKLRQVRKTVPMKTPIIVMIDYIQLMSNVPEETHGKSDEAILDVRATKLNALWKPHNACIIELSQLTREVEKRNPPRPIMSDMKGSGALEANADVVMLMYRPDYYSKNPVDSESGKSLNGMVEFIVHKNRHGKRGSAYGKFLNRYSKFEDYKQEDNGIVSGGDEPF